MPANTIGLGTAKEMLEPLSEKLQEKVQEGVEVSKRALKNVRERAEILLDDAAHDMKRHPWESAGVALAIGAVIGITVGFFIGKALARPQRRFFFF